MKRDDKQKKQPEVKSVLLQTYFTSLLSLVLCVGMFMGTSYAWFTSEVNNEGNEIYIGTLDVEMEKKTGTETKTETVDGQQTEVTVDKWASLSAKNDSGVNKTKLFDSGTRWEPGYTALETVRIKDEGDLAFNYQLHFLLPADTDAVAKEKLLKAAGIFDVWVYPHGAGEAPNPANYAAIIAADSGWNSLGSLADVLSGKVVLSGEMDREAVAKADPVAHTYTIALHMQEKASGSELMGQKIGLNVKLVAYQMVSEQDDFGTDYDKMQAVFTVEQLQEALDAATGETLIVLGADMAGDVTVTQKPDVKITIDGAGKTFSGIITVDGKSKRYESAALTIENVKFSGVTCPDSKVDPDAYIRLGCNNDARYTNHVTVKSCTFSCTDGSMVAVKSYTGGDYNVTLESLTVNEGMHSLAQLKNVEKNLVVTGCKVNSKNGLNINNGNNLAMRSCTFDVKGYTVRFGSDGGVYDRNYTIADSTLKSACAEAGDAVLEFRAGAVKSTLTLTNTTVEGTTKVKGNTTDTVINGLN